MNRLSEIKEQNTNLSVIFTKDKNTRRYIHMKNKITKLLDKIESEELLKRIYEFIKYIYIYGK